ncbi:MAG: bifunctional metallophosphatase/5'-nucleotidase [Dorea sp.]|jgi:5'-nucleotidase/UDP-sugar diphosphatase|nr:bifunctional metallophosphatase/5'-nucleotidase [Dorea sp.]
MNFRKRVRSAVLLVILLCSLSVGSVVAGERNEKQDTVTLLFTHDIHSRLDEYKVQGTGEQEEGETVFAGGFARLKTRIDERRAANPATFVFDGGDFSMGTLYQTIYETQAAELTMLGRIGVDATTFGNHEFDYRAEGVSNMFRSAVRNAGEDETLTLPQFLTANIDWEKNDSKDNRMIQQALEDYGSKEYTVIEREGIRVGVYGVLGEDAEICAPESGIDFDDIVETSKRVVEELKKEDVDMIVCLSHSGTSEEEDASEDEILAEEVPEIDVIISGHTHTTLEEPIISGDTVIASAGSYGRNLGELELVPAENGRWKLAEYRLNSMDESVEQDKEIENYLSEYRSVIDDEYLSRFGYRMEQLLAENTIPFTQIDDFGDELREDTLGSLIADSYVYAVKKAEGADYVPVDLAVVASGVVRDSFQKGEITVSDAFNVSALGIGPDRITGYPLVGVYLTGKELKTVAEIDASISPIMTYAQIYPSGMSWTFNPNRLILNRVTGTGMTGDTVGEEEAFIQDNLTEIEDDKLYRVVSGLYSAQMLGAVEDKSKGILKLTPKNAEGEVITDFEDYIIRDGEGYELKEWYALAGYLESFTKNEKGISQIPVRYSEEEGRKVIHDSAGLAEVLGNPNRFALAVYGIALSLAGLLAAAALYAARKRKRRKSEKKREDKK